MTVQSVFDVIMDLIGEALFFDKACALFFALFAV